MKFNKLPHVSLRVIEFTFIILYKAVGGFRAIHISGVEIYHMGQQVLGSYPIHFHLCDDVDEIGGYQEPTYVKELSIHNCFSRCVTIHRTDGILVWHKPLQLKHFISFHENRPSSYRFTQANQRIPLKGVFASEDNLRE